MRAKPLEAQPWSLHRVRIVPSEAVVGLQVQGSTAETRELGLIFESNWLGVDPRLSFLPCRATGLVPGTLLTRPGHP